MQPNRTIPPCPICGGPVPASKWAYRQRIFCSWTCGNAVKVHPKGPRPEKWETRTCPVDGKQFTVRHYKPYRFCSKKCGAAVAARLPRDPSKWTTTVCPGCDTAFEHLASWPRTYCSLACRTRHVMAISGRITRFEKSCEQCGGPFMTYPQVDARFCSMPCWGRWSSEHIAGEAHPMYRGGYDPYYGPDWRPARRAARARDKICQDCGISPADLGKALDVHHITPFRTFGRERHEEANRLDNLVSLCPPCHITREWATNWRQA